MIDNDAFVRAIATAVDVSFDSVTSETLLLEDLEVDSLLSLEISAQVKSAVGVRLEPQTITAAKSVGELYVTACARESD